MNRRGRVLSWVWASLMLVGAVACSDGGTPALVSDAATLDQLVADAELVDVSVSVDTASMDLAEPDAGLPSTCEPGEGCFGEPCDGNDDCLSGICSMHMGEMVCSKTCDETCPEGWECTLVGGVSDGQYVCVSNFSHLCLPCESTEGCAGSTPNACVKYEGGSSFCGGACDDDTPCPSGYICQEAETSTGAVTFQCVSESGSCTCTSLAIESGLGTGCSNSNDYGTCEGMRICQEEGLSACDAIHR